MFGLTHFSPYALRFSYTYYVTTVTAKAGINALWVHILNFLARSRSRKKRLCSFVIPVRFSGRLSVCIGAARTRRISVKSDIANFNENPYRNYVFFLIPKNISNFT